VGTLSGVVTKLGAGVRMKLDWGHLLEGGMSCFWTLYRESESAAIFHSKGAPPSNMLLIQ